MSINDKVLSPEEAMKTFEAIASEPEPVQILRPNDGTVELPGGLLTDAGTLVTSAEVRELTGADEEAIYKYASPGKKLLTILKRGTVSVGGEPVTDAMFDKLLSGDREALLVAIRAVTFGDQVDLTATCPSCMESGDFSVSLYDDVTEKKVTAEDYRWDLALSKGRSARLCLPSGKLQTQLFESSESKTLAELHTMIIAECLLTFNDKPSAGMSTARNLSIADRETIIASIFEKSPGPRLGEVSKPCPSCGEVVPLPMSIAELFRL